jgi:alpha-tubulin suppressor-like RCC1 family protein
VDKSIRKNISSTVKGFLSRIVIAVLVLQNFTYAVPATEAAQQAGTVVSPMVATGSQHTLALKSDGTVWSWGQNDSGQIGNNTNAPNIFAPVQVHGVADSGFLTGVMSISAGGSNSLALKSGGTVFAWGNNASGQIGDATTTERDVPVAVSGLSGVTAIAAGSQHSLALKSDGTVWSWGDNAFGQLGDGNSPTNSGTATQISGLADVTAIAAGTYSSFALKSDGTVWSWGYNGKGALGDTTVIDRDTPVQVSGLTDVKAISGSRAVKSDGSAWAWGLNLQGQLGINAFDFSDHATPVQVHGVGNVGFLTGVVSIFSTGSETFASKADGTMFSWGFNVNGELGDGSYTDRKVPVQVSGISGVTAISQQTALKSNGTIWKWGDDENGFIGDGAGSSSSNVPVQSSITLYVSPDGVIAIAAGSSHSLAIKSNGTVWAWGFNGNGQLGNGTNTNSNVPVPVSGLTSITAIAAGQGHSVALKSDGTVWAWGAGGYGQLGDGTNTDSNVPIQVPGLIGVTAVAAGNDHVLALKSDGTVWAWGTGGYGQLGDGSNSNSSVPVQVHGAGDIGFLTGVTAIASFVNYGDHSLAIKADGTAWAWGWNAEGELGDGTNTDSSVPVPVSGITGVSAIAGGSFHSVALTSDGTAWAWGSNGVGQLGDGTNTNSNVPVPVSVLTGVRAITGGDGYAMAIKSDGTVWAWGYNGNGNLGNGTGGDFTNTFDSNAPVQVHGENDIGFLAGATAIAGGAQHSLARKSDGTVWAWGGNSSGSLGDGTNTDSNVPVLVLFSAPPVPSGPNTTANRVLMSRLQVSTPADVTVSFNLTGTVSTDLTITFDPAFTGLSIAGATASTPSAPSCTGTITSVGNVITVPKTACTGDIIISGITVTNPVTPGPYLVSWVNDSPGYSLVAIVDSDQVTVSASISPTITFDLDAGIAAGETAAPYTVALGALTTSAVNHSDHSGVNSIFAQLDTNATSGAQVTVLSANAKLKSDSVPSDVIPNDMGTMSAGAANYGICVSTAAPPAAGTGTFQPSAPYDAGTCIPTGSSNDVKGLSSGVPTPILDSNSAPLTGGNAEILVNAAIDTSTAAHSDYTDTLTFVATGTF